VLPGHHLTSPAVSLDGCLLAAVANRMGVYRYRIVVFSLKTGDLIAERKCGSVHSPCFFPDSKWLAIPKSGGMSGEPIDLWEIPISGTL